MIVEKGFIIDLPISHLLPVYPASHVQLKSATKSVQVPLVQGLSEQSSISTNQRFKTLKHF